MPIVLGSLSLVGSAAVVFVMYFLYWVLWVGLDYCHGLIRCYLDGGFWSCPCFGCFCLAFCFGVVLLFFCRLLLVRFPLVYLGSDLRFTPHYTRYICPFAFALLVFSLSQTWAKHALTAASWGKKRSFSCFTVLVPHTGVSLSTYISPCHVLKVCSLLYLDAPYSTWC